MDNKNITTYWQINNCDNNSNPTLEPVFLVNDPFGNEVMISKGSLFYDPIYKAYCDRGYMPAQQIFETFVPHKYFPTNISVNEYHKTFDTSVDFSDPNAPFVMYNNIEQAENSNVDYKNPCKILSFDSIGSYVNVNNKYYLSDDVYILVRRPTDSVAESKLKKDIFCADVFIGLDNSNSATILKAVEVKYDINCQFDNISIDIYLKELSIKVY